MQSKAFLWVKLSLSLANASQTPARTIHLAKNELGKVQVNLLQKKKYRETNCRSIEGCLRVNGDFFSCLIQITSRKDQLKDN